jgi:hypothetical protein
VRWPFGHRATAPQEAAAPAPVRAHDAWRTAAPLQRASGAPPVVAPVQPFAASLATRNPPELALQALGHEVSPLASGGLLIASSARPAEPATAGRLELPLQRSGHDRAALAGTVQSDPGGADPAFALHPADEPAGNAPDLAPIQRAIGGEPPMTSASGVGLPGRPAGLLDLRRLTGAGPDRPAVPAPVAAQRMEARPVQDPPQAATVRRPSLGQARRLGLGAPLEPTLQRVAQPLAVVPSEASGPSLPLAGARQPGSAVLTGPAGADAAMATNSSSPPFPGATGLTGPDTGPGSGADATWGPAGRGVAGLALVQPLSIQRVGGADRAGTRRTNLVDARAADRSPALGAPDGTAVRPMPSVARLVASGAGEPGPGAGSDDGQAASVGTSPIVRGLPGSLAGPGPAPVQRAGGPGPTVPARPPGPIASRLAIGAGRTPASPHRPAVPEPATAAWPALPMPASRPAGLPIQRDVAPAAAEPGLERAVPALEIPPAAVQRAIEVPEFSLGASPPSPAPAGGAAAGTALSASPANQERELDELARRLYGRIRSRLAAELLADRERAGMITDLR